MACIEQNGNINGTGVTVTDTAYAELESFTNFSFLEGGSHPEELVVTAAALGHRALAVTDRNTMAGVVRAHSAAKQHQLPLLVGCRLDFRDAPSLLCYPVDRAAYGRLTQVLSTGKRRAPKGDCHLTLADFLEARGDHIVIALAPDDRPDAAFPAFLATLREHFGDRAFLAAHVLGRGDDARRLATLTGLGMPLVATNAVLYHDPARRRVQDVLTCIRDGVTIDTAGRRLEPNAERHLRAPSEMARLFADHPAAIENTARIADACTFNLDDLTYEYPDDDVPAGETAQGALERLTEAGAAERYPDGVPQKVRDQIDHELALIGRMDYAPYFLTVYDLVAFARARGILCQGRGSAANSAVCYCLGITGVDPARSDLLFERFISEERGEPPDIDVDFEHERREEVIQYVYAKYGRHRAGLAAAVIGYRTRGALREVGKALGLSEDVTGALAGLAAHGEHGRVPDARVREAGLDPAEPRIAMTLDIAAEIRGFPRHLSQHVGGFVLTRGRLDHYVPVANAAMEGRTFVEWDKDDLDALGLLKVDVLSLGMLSCIRRAFDLIRAHHGRELSLADVPAEDPGVYAMLSRGDSLGVFQVESRAQMAMLPRLRPATFYDLVIEVAIVRPGPIQGEMVHPYLRRRNGEEAVDYPSEELRRVLEKTLGVPLFQEQAMRIAMVAADFSPGEADRLRKAMAAWRKKGTLHGFRDRFVQGMVERGYDRDFAVRCFTQIEGFGEYGFPESHAASFALLVYVSAWLKHHYPAAFACALLNSQPMGFYAPAQIVRDARAHGVTVRPVDVNHSGRDHRLESDGASGGNEEDSLPPGERATARRPGQGRAKGPQGPPAREGGAWNAPHSGKNLRLGLRQIEGLGRADAEALAAHRPYRDVADVRRRAGVGRAALERLARADALASLAAGRREALWAVRRLADAPALPLFEAAGTDEAGREPDVSLPDLPPGEAVVEDYATLRLTLRRHPLALLREPLKPEGLTPAETLATLKNDARVRVAGLVTARQRPGSADGVVFVTLEDETGNANLIVRPTEVERFRRPLLASRLMAAKGRLQKAEGVIHVIADRLDDLSGYLLHLAPEAAPLAPDSREFQ